MELNPQCFPCTMICNPLCEAHPECPCPALYPEWRVSWTSCFRKFAVLGPNDDTLSFGFVACEAVGVCIDVYHVCCKVIDSVTMQVKPSLVASASTEECKDNLGTPIYGCYPVCPGPPQNPPLPPCDTTGNGLIDGSPAMSEEIQSEQKSNTAQQTKQSVVTQPPSKGSRQEQKNSQNTARTRQQQK